MVEYIKRTHEHCSQSLPHHTKTKVIYEREKHNLTNVLRNVFANHNHHLSNCSISKSTGHKLKHRLETFILQLLRKIKPQNECTVFSNARTQDESLGRAASRMMLVVTYYIVTSCTTVLGPREIESTDTTMKRL